MYNLQELFEHGYVEKVESEPTHLGSGYKIRVKLHNYSIGGITIDVGIDEGLSDAVALINEVIEVDDSIVASNKNKAEVRHAIRKATKEELDELGKFFEDSRQAFKD